MRIIDGSAAAAKLADWVNPAPAAVEAAYWRGMARTRARLLERMYHHADRTRARRERATLVWALVATVALAAVIAGRVLG